MNTPARIVFASALLALSALAATAAPAAATQDRPRVVAAVVDFANRTGDDAWEPVGQGLADMVTSDLSWVPNMILVERARLEAVMAELSLQRSAFVDPETAQALGKGLGAPHVVTGALTAVAPQVRLDIRLVAVASGEVVLADGLAGPADRFFELEAALVARFAKALKLKLNPDADPSKVAKLSSVKTYGEALAARDRGDLKAASSKLSQVVGAEPAFALGQARYAEVLQALRAARGRREGAVSELDRRLTAKADAVLAEPPAPRDAEASGRRMAYRVLRGNLMLRQLRDGLGRERDDGKRPVPAAQRDALLALAAAYVDNAEAFIAELVAWRAAGRAFHDLALTNAELDAEDAAAAERAGLGGEPGIWSFATPGWVARSVAELVFEGKPDYYGDIEFEMTPTLAETDARWSQRGYRLLADALAEVDGPVPPEDKAQLGAKVLHTWARALLREGRKMEALARWQMILDRYPTHEDYAEYEALIERVLSAP